MLLGIKTHQACQGATRHRLGRAACDPSRAKGWKVSARLPRAVTEVTGVTLNVSVHCLLMTAGGAHATGRLCGVRR